jgi:HNH endonuclease
MKLLFERIFEKIVGSSDGCWVWQGAKSCGYGHIKIDGKYRLVHVYLWELENGPVPPGKELDHFKCDTRACVHPLHTRPATHRENTLRGNSFAALNRAKTHCSKSHSLEDPANLVASHLKLGTRRCRTCRNEWDRHRRHAKKLLTM